MKKNGFTLIELVVVIVILGILAVSAAPRFLNLQVDARNATLHAMKGTINGAMGIAYGKLAIQGLENESRVSSADYPDLFSQCGTDEGDISNLCVFRYGYPAADWGTLPALVTNLSAVEGSDWFIHDQNTVSVSGGFMSSIKISPKGFRDTTKCHILYENWLVLVDTAMYSPPKLTVVPCD